ncbi:hypothetical protein INR49_006273 [Caranx melampygus]|nr:hypothetical protein INR49_006273 [Caranx melampygus]
MPFKFSKEKFWLEPPSEQQRKQLEEELKLSGTNLKSHAWYHGHIPWEVSESLVLNHGDFLIRDSQSSPGDFVLTDRWEQKTLHFLIKKTVVQSSETYTRIQYSLEGEAFDSIPALVHFYVGSRAALSRRSGAQIHRPVNRTLPLSYLETAFCTAAGPASGPRGPNSREERVCPSSPSSLHHREADVSREDQTVQTTRETSLLTPYNNNKKDQREQSDCQQKGHHVDQVVLDGRHLVRLCSEVWSTFVPHDELDPENGTVQRFHGLIPVDVGQCLHLLPVARLIEHLLDRLQEVVFVQCCNVDNFGHTSGFHPGEVVWLVEHEGHADQGDAMVDGLLHAVGASVGHKQSDDLLRKLGKSGSDSLGDVLRKLRHQGSQCHDDDAVFPGALDELLQLCGQGLGGLALKP